MLPKLQILVFPLLTMFCLQLLLYSHINSTSSGGGNNANGGQPTIITLPITGNETNILPISPLVTANTAK